MMKTALEWARELCRGINDDEKLKNVEWCFREAMEAQYRETWAEAMDAAATESRFHATHDECEQAIRNLPCPPFKPKGSGE